MANIQKYLANIKICFENVQIFSNLVISQTNSLKLIAPFPSWSISLISSCNDDHDHDDHDDHDHEDDGDDDDDNDEDDEDDDDKDNLHYDCNALFYFFLLFLPKNMEEIAVFHFTETHQFILGSALRT